MKKKETNGIFLMALAECTHSWCNEREERLYETFSSALLGDQSQRALLKFLSDVLEIYWNVQVEEDLQEIARVARKLGLKKLPISFGLLRGKFQ